MFSLFVFVEGLSPEFGTFGISCVERDWCQRAVVVHVPRIGDGQIFSNLVHVGQAITSMAHETKFDRRAVAPAS